MRLILVRHGETLWNAERRLQGHADAELSERGMEQARRLVPMLQALRPARAVASDLGRTRRTAELLGYADCATDPRLRERNLGEWTGRTKPEILDSADRERYLRWQAGVYVPDGAESWDAFRTRIAAGLRHWLAAGEGDLLAIVHNGVIRAACHGFLDLPPSRLQPLTPGTATILCFAGTDFSAARLEAYNLGPFAPDASAAD